MGLLNFDFNFVLVGILYASRLGACFVRGRRYVKNDDRVRNNSDFAETGTLCGDPEKPMITFTNNEKKKKYTYML